MNRFLVIGGASFDVLHLADQTVESVGGAGMYTAMAARRCGAQVSMLSPRPDPPPERLKPIAGHLVEWLGPDISPEQMLQFEISYRGGKTEYPKMSLDAVAIVNGFFFANARKRCPEMTEPQCRLCPLDPVCAHRKEFFQPVLRTSFY